MKRQYLNPKEMSTPRFYSHAVTAEGGGTLVGVEALVHPDLLLEVEVIAAI